MVIIDRQMRCSNRDIIRPIINAPCDLPLWYLNTFEQSVYTTHKLNGAVGSIECVVTTNS